MQANTGDNFSIVGDNIGVELFHVMSPFLEQKTLYQFVKDTTWKGLV